MTLEDIIKKHVKKSKIPGISVGIVNENSIKTFDYGEIKKGSNVTPTPDTLYEIGSMTKVFTGILTAKLQEEGLLSLDDPITKFLPEFLDSDFDKNKITLYHLVTHTSGIIEIPFREYPKNIIKWMFRMGDGTFFPPRYSYETPELLDEVSKIHLKVKPGTKYLYSNTGVGLVGKILERVTNSTYEELVKNRICNVLGLSDTGITVSEEQKQRLATGYLYTGKESEPIYIPAIESAGSLRSTVSDILKFLKANLGLTDSSLSPVLEYCQNTRITPGLGWLIKILPRTKNTPKSFEAGLGWGVFNFENRQIIGHNGGTEGFSTLMQMNTGKKTGVVILTNNALKDPSKLGNKLLGIGIS